VVASRAADCISIYLAKVGGIVGALNVGAVAAAAGLPCDVNGSIESGVGNGGLLLTVRDNGVGFDPGQDRARASLGLASMRQRVALVGGKLNIDSKPLQT
jgi:hypothetical protein